MGGVVVVVVEEARDGGVAEGKDCGAGVWRRSPRVKVSWHPPRLALHHRYSPTRCLVPPSSPPPFPFHNATLLSLLSRYAALGNTALALTAQGLG